MSEVRVVLPFDVLVGDNRKHLNRKVLTPEYRQAKQAIHLMGLDQVRGERPVYPDGSVTVEYLWWMPDRRKRDPTNYLKIVNDALEGILWTDDHQIGSISIYVAGITKEDPGVTITAYRGLHRAVLLDA